MYENAESTRYPDLTTFWQPWFDMTPEVWKNMAGIAADYFEDYASFASSLQYTNEEYLRQLQLNGLTRQESSPNGQQAAQLAPLPEIGARATRSRTISRSTIAHFAEVSGDVNPIHLDPDQAARSPFGERIAHGFLVAALISAVVGNDLPGPGTIYMGQTLKFLAPVHIGDVITASVEVIAIHEAKRILTLRTECTNQKGTTVLTGEAIVKFMRELETGS